MASSSGAGAAMAASANGKLRPLYGRRIGSDHMVGRRNNVTAYVAAGGTLADYARIHRITVSAARRLLEQGAR